MIHAHVDYLIDDIHANDQILRGQLHWCSIEPFEVAISLTGLMNVREPFAAPATFSVSRSLLYGGSLTRFGKPHGDGRIRTWSVATQWLVVELIWTGRSIQIYLPLRTTLEFLHEVMEMCPDSLASEITDELLKDELRELLDSGT